MKRPSLVPTLLSSLVLTGLLAAPALAVDPPVPGVQSSEIGTINGWTVWAGWNASFSESYAPTSETYNWTIFFAPEGIYAGLTSAESQISSEDVFASIGAFAGMYAAPHVDQLTWDEFTALSGYTVTTGLDIVSMPAGPVSGGSLSFSAGPTLFHVGDTFVRAFQLNAAVAVSVALLSLPGAAVAIDTRSNLTNEDTGFWPVLLWDMDVDPDSDPISNIVGQLARVLAEGPATQSPVALSMAKRFLPVLLAYQPAELGGTAGSLGEYVGTFVSNPATTPLSSPADGTVDGLIAQADAWVASGDEDAPAQMIADPPISLGAVQRSLRPAKQATEAAFEVAYRNGYDAAVERGDREDNVIYSDCVVTEYCTPGETCTISVDAAEIAAAFPGTSAADFEGAYVWFDIPTESYVSSGTAGGEQEVELVDGRADYTFIQTATYPLLLGAAVDRDFANNLTGGKNLELCARQVVFVTPVATDDVEVSGGTLTSVTTLAVNELPNAEGAPEDMLMGLVQVEADCDPGATVTFTISLPDPAPFGYSWFKLTAAGGWIDLIEAPAPNGDHATFSEDRRTVTMTVTDDGPLDHDPTPGHLLDPSGLGLQSGASVSPSSGGGGHSGGGCVTSRVPRAPLSALVWVLGLGLFRRRRDTRPLFPSDQG